MQSTFFRGTSLEQDTRFANKNKQLIAKMKCPTNFRVQVDMGKVALETIKPWISQRITELLGIEDDVVVNLCFNMLEGAQDTIDPRELQINLTGFMGQDARTFVSELWTLLISAQNSDSGIPAELLQQFVADQAVVDVVPPPPPAIGHTIDDQGRTVRSSSREPRRRSRSPRERRRRSRSPRDRRRRSRSPRKRRSSRSPARRRFENNHKHRSPSPTRRSRSSHRPRRRSSPRRGSMSPRRSRRSRSRHRSGSRPRRSHRDDERKRRRRHRRRHSASSSSRSPSPKKNTPSPPRQRQALSPVDLPVVPFPAPDFDPRQAEDQLRILALRSIVINKNKIKNKDDQSDDGKSS